MKGIFKALIAIVVISVTVTVGVTVYNKVADSPKGTIEKLETAYNNLDIDSMVECFDPSVQAFYSGANSVLGELVGFDISDMASMVPFIANFDDDIDFEDLPKIEIKINDIDKTSDTTAVVYCTIMSQGYGGEPEEDDIDMVKIDGEWYISGTEFYDSF